MNEFLQHFVIMQETEAPCLPFTVGGVTQHGSTHVNNQDAMSLHVGNDIIIGVVCDGCSTGPSFLAPNDSSFAETGAQLVTALALGHTKILARKMEGDELADELTVRLRCDINGLLRILDIKEASEAMNKEMAILREHHLQQFFMSTLLLFVVTPETYLVMHCGDGLFGVNGVITNLNAIHSGAYLANGLSSTFLAGDAPAIKICANGQTDQLQNLLIATDGVLELAEKGNLLEMVTSLDNRQYKLGWGRVPFLREFRSRVARPFEAVSRTDHDDRTLIMLRRIPDACVVTS